MPYLSNNCYLREEPRHATATCHRRPFSQWGLDFIGMINPPSSAQHKYGLTTIDYCTRWLEAKALKSYTTDVVINFLEICVVTRIGYPHVFIYDKEPAFTSLRFSSWAFEYDITLKFSSNYYPLGNGLAKSTNKNLKCH